MSRHTLGSDPDLTTILNLFETKVEHIRVAPLLHDDGTPTTLFARHTNIPGHNQGALDNAVIDFVGGGGLNGWAALGALRSGARTIRISDDDTVDETNLSRQFFFPQDLGEHKASALPRNLAPHAVGGATITGINKRYPECNKINPIDADLIICGIDNNLGRLAVAREARRRHIPAIFTMLSADGLIARSFLQGPATEDACLWCALPNLNPDSATPCVAAIVSSCFLAAGMTLFFMYRALMGWPDGTQPFNYRNIDLANRLPEQIGLVSRRIDCPICSKV